MTSRDDEALPITPTARQLHFDVEMGQRIHSTTQVDLGSSDLEQPRGARIKKRCKACFRLLSHKLSSKETVQGVWDCTKRLLSFLWSFRNFFMAYFSLVLAILSMTDVVGLMKNGHRVLPVLNPIVDAYFIVNALYHCCKDKNKTWWKTVIHVVSFLPLSTIFVFVGLAGKVSGVAVCLCSLYLLWLLHALTCSFSI